MEIIKAPHPVLSRKAKPVRGLIDPSLIQDMFKTMYAEQGWGLAAPQVGISLRFFVMHIHDQEVIINPVIISKSKKTKFDEACLSIPGETICKDRYREITIRYNKLDNSQCQRTFHDLEAICIQHEIDHLNGILII